MKFKFSGLSVALFFLGASLWAQNFQLSHSEINFQTRTETKTDSLSFTINNVKNKTISIRLSIPFRVFSSQPFRLKDSLIVLPPNGTKQVWVYCRVVHNISQSAHLLVFCEDTTLPAQNEIIKLQVQGRYTKSYYSQTENLTEEALKAALKARIGQGYNSLSYDAARGVMYGNLDNKNDSVTCVYTLRKAKFNTTAGATSNNFNCEHTFPQGFFSQNLPMRSDMHHLYSTDDGANNSRGNLPFGVATAPFVQPTVNAPSKNGGGKYEPQDGHKGNCARAMMYFVLRYQDYANFFAPQEQILRTWHKTYQPGPADTLRNAKIFAQQNNRNPFVDYPQFADRIKNLISPSVSDSSTLWRQSQNALRIKNNFPSQALSVSVWNEGNRRIFVRNIRFALNQYIFLNGSEQNFTLGFNDAKVLRFASSDPNEEYFSDTLILETSDPAQPVVRIPVDVSSPLAVEKKQRESILLYPNPAENEITIRIPESEIETEIQVSNAEGKLLIIRQIQRNHEALSLKDLGPGLYIVTVRTGLATERFKVVKH
jgi:endonuclease I